MMQLNRTVLDPRNIQTLNPQQLAVVVNYVIHSGKRQAWVMCDEHPFQIFVIPEKDGYPLTHIVDCLDNHFENLVFYPDQKQFIKNYTIKSSTKFGIEDISLSEIGKTIASKVIMLLGKIIRIGYEILKLAAKDILLLAGFTGKQLLRLFLSLLATLVDSYESIPMKEEAVVQRERADDLRSYIQKIDDIDISVNAGEINKQAFQKIIAIIRDEVEDAQDFKGSFMDELDKDVPIAMHMGQRVRM